MKSALLMIKERSGRHTARTTPTGRSGFAKAVVQHLEVRQRPARKTEQPETIESRFATVRHWTDRTKGCLTRDGMLAMIYKRGLCAGCRWRRLCGFESRAKIVDAVKFRDGVEVHNVVRGH